jgi:hypothetical protein
MKTALTILYSILLAGLGMGSASAQSISVKLTGNVASWSDSAGVLGGQVATGQTVTATYTYDASTPDLHPSPSTGRYEPSTAQGAGVRVDIGSLTFESNSSSAISVDVYPVPQGGTGGGYFSLVSLFNEPLANGTSVDQIAIVFASGNTTPISDALPSDPPNVQDFGFRRIRIVGAGYGMEVQAEITSAELVLPTIEVSPAAGSFLRQQRFDAAVLLPAGAQASSMQASVNGNPVALSFPGTCQAVLPNSVGLPAILCPDAHAVFATMTGDTTVEWEVTLTDGTVYEDSVIWNLLP